MTRHGVLILLVILISLASSCCVPGAREGSRAGNRAEASQGGAAVKERLAAERFFKEHEKRVAYEESGQRLRLANRHIGIEFMAGEKRFSLSRLYGIARGVDFVSPSSAASPQDLWRLTLRRERGRDTADAAVSSRSQAKTSNWVGYGESAATLHLKWSGLDVREDQGCLDVEVSVTVRQDDPLSRWRISVSNRSKTYGLWRIVFPILDLCPVGDSAEANRLVWPYGRGVVMRELFSQQSRYHEGIRCGAGYPGSLNMQFQALYGAEGQGIYLAMHDGNGYLKEFEFSPNPARQVLTYSVSHLPNNMGYPAEDFRMSYDACMGPFSGDWYDACQIYREWAVKQRWCAKGPLVSREDIPRWYKEAPITLLCVSNTGDDAVLAARDRVLPFLSFIGTELPICWYTWKKHIPDMTDYNSDRCPWKVPDKQATPCSNIHDGNYPYLPALPSLSAVCEEISKAGGHVKPYVCARIYDPGLNENAPLAAQAKPNAARDVDGAIQYGESVGVAWRMCPHTEWWQNRMAETAVELIKREHAGGIYFDTFRGGAYHCFDTGHGHAHGGGIEPYSGAHELATAVREAMKRANPEAVMSGESPCETAIDLLDGFLYVYTMGSEIALERTDVPLLAAVYGDYICRYGHWLNPKSDGFYIQCASLFAEGAQIGRLEVQYDDYLAGFEAGSPYTEQMTFLRKLARYWREDSGGKYLAYGRLVRPLRFVQPDPMPIASYEEHVCSLGRISVSALQAAVFQSPDGSLGVFLVNVTEKALPYQFELAPGRYPIRKSQAYHITPITETGRRLKTTRQKGKVAFGGTIAGHDVLFLEVAPDTK